MRLDLAPYRSSEHFHQLKAALPRAKNYFSERTGIDKDPTLGVGSNTFRAFRGIEKPSLMFRRWASEVIRSKQFQSEILAASTQPMFETVHDWLNQTLEHHWKSECGQQLSLAHRYKLVDLLVKRLCRLELPDDRMNANLVMHGHVPIDSLVLRALDHLFSGAFLTDGRAMGHIKTEQAYRFYQDPITNLMLELDAPALYFDFYAWNVTKDA